ncbi:MAG: metallophosphoesterase [Kiritimatiellae bacterium]|nr:metallophosphoesterase [Kiritimatiellia bacterium]
MMTSRRLFLSGMAAAGVSSVVSRTDAAQDQAGGNSIARDPNLAVFISDLHLNGLRDEVPTHLYEEQCFRKTVQDILALRPRPAQVVCFGDIAYHWGQPEDYRLAFALFRPLVEAGIKVTFGMGNHDHRENFLELWPEYRKSTLVPGRIVSRVELPHADLLMLDTLNAKPILKKQGSFPGEMDAAQREWLTETLEATTKPVFTCSHHHPNEDTVKIGKLLHSSRSCAGHIYGHWHIWMRNFIHDGWLPQDLLSIACLPSTGHWGDIGFVTFRTYPDKAVLTLHQKAFFFTGGPEEHPRNCEEIVREKNGQSFTFLL